MSQTPIAPTRLSMLGILVVVLVVCICAGGGVLVYQHTLGTQTATPRPKTSPAANSSGAKYLDIAEWGIKLPLSAQIQDAYYVISASSYDPATGQPDTIWLGLTSLNSRGCNAALNNQGQDTALGSIVRGRPTDTDPISGKSFTSEFPHGITIGKYYYAYSSGANTQPCASGTTRQSINTAFTTALRSAVADSTR